MACSRAQGILRSELRRQPLFCQSLQNAIIPGPPTILIRQLSRKKPSRPLHPLLLLSHRLLQAWHLRTTVFIYLGFSGGNLRKDMARYFSHGVSCGYVGRSCSMESLSWSEQAVCTLPLQSSHLSVVGLHTQCPREPRRSYEAFLTQPWSFPQHHSLGIR